MDMIKMGAFLQSLRKEQGLTQEQLGEKLHVGGKTISRWETGAYMPPVEMLLALSELYGVSMNELVCGERLTLEELPAKAEENLAAVMKEQEAFQLKERRHFWMTKWQQDHRWAFVLLIVLTIILQIFSAGCDRLDLVAIVALVAVCIAVFFRNHRDDYIEHHLYDDMLDE